VGTQIAKSSHDLFGKPVHPGEIFLDVLKPLVSNKVLQDTTDYLDLLFTPHVKEQLVQSINPLSDVQIFVTNRLGKSVIRHLSFAFNRTISDGRVTHLLVTVQDNTERKELEVALQAQKQGAQKEMSMMLKALETDSGQLAEFATRSEKELLHVNRELRELSGSTSAQQSKTVIESVFRRMHAFKGEAQSLGLDVLSLEAHAMESLLAQMRGGEAPAQEALLQMPIHLESLLSKLTVFREMASRQQSLAPPAQAPSPVAPVAKPAPSLNAQLTMLANEVARDTGKSVELHIQMPSISHWPTPLQQCIKDISIQLVRNAVAHGIEAPSQRVASGKPVAGQVTISLSATAGQWLLSVRDDGAGLSAERIRHQLGQLGWYNAAQLLAMDDRAAIAHIFKPGFSTAASTGASHLHAGRGVGLDVVQAQAKQLGAQMGLGSVPGQYTEFRLKFAGGQP
jgi:two-component system, chemotaxis family, sensor kinase CheA